MLKRKRVYFDCVFCVDVRVKKDLKCVSIIIMFGWNETMGSYNTLVRDRR